MVEFPTIYAKLFTLKMW